MDLKFWRQILQIREQVTAQLEIARETGLIGSSLDAEVDLFCTPDREELLGKLGDELRFVLITSAARLHNMGNKPRELNTQNGLAIRVSRSSHDKCARCWHLRDDVGKHREHPMLCGRCVDNVQGKGEVRRYA